jgi:hypothetical protein
METAERHRRTDPQQTLRFCLTARQCSLSLVDFSQDALSSFVKVHSFFRGREAAGAPRDQADPGAALQRSETLADDAERQVHFARSRGKASCCDDTDESPQFVYVIEHEDLLILSIGWGFPSPESG